jgi:hypothetical protein
MKFLIILCLLFCACCVAAHGRAAGDLQLRVRLTTGERSKDSNAQITTITIEPHVKAIVWEQTYSGSRRNTPALRKKYKLTPADMQKLIALLESKRLFVTDSIELPGNSAFYQYFAISIESALGNKRGAISISGARTATQVKEEKLYRDAVALVKELQRIINSHGGNLFFEEPVMQK